MQITSATTIVFSLIIVVCGLADGNAAATAAAHFSAHEAKSSNSNSDSTDVRPPTRRRDAQAPKEYVIVNADTNANISQGSDNVLPNALIRKIVTILGKRPASAGIVAPSSPSGSAPTPSADPNKQLFGGRLPPFIERIIQRIQNYFSVYNPPEYFDNNRPPPSSTQQQAGITLICSNSAEAGESVSCNEMNSSEQPDEQQEQEQEQGEMLEMCDGTSSGGNAAESQDEYNVVVTHTVVQDSSLNVYSPQQPIASSPADSTQMVSNVVVILEPAVGQYSPPPLDNPDKNKFYVYVNPTSANKNQQQQQYDHRLKTWNESVVDDEDTAATDKAENSRPYMNTTYTVIIRGDKLQEYNDAAAADNSSSRPEIAIYIRNSTAKKSKKCKPSSSTSPTKASQTADFETEDCEQNAQSPSLTSRSVNLSQSPNEQNVESGADEAKAKSKPTAGNDNQNSNKVPNINLMLIPPTSNLGDQQQKFKNRSCTSKNKINKNPQLEYYVLKPDNGNKKPAKMDDKEKPTAKYFLQKTSIDGPALSQTYLPPPPSPSSSPLSDGQQRK